MREDQINGYIKGILLASVLQLMELERKSCMLKITSHDNTGYIYVTDGEIIDAENNGMNGEKAALEILGWDDVHITLDGKQPKRKRTINLSINHILMESYRLKDEKNNINNVINQIHSSLLNNVHLEDISSKALDEFSKMEGFLGAIAFTPKGDEIDCTQSNGYILNKPNLSILAKTVLPNACEVSNLLKAGDEVIVHIMADKINYFITCLYDNNYDSKESNIVDYHTYVIIMDIHTNTWLARMRIEAIFKRLTLRA